MQTNLVTIYVENKGEGSFTVTDKDEQCMKTAVASYEILTNVLETNYHLGGKMVVLHLRDFNYPVKYVNEKGIEVAPINQDQEIDQSLLLLFQ